MSVLSNLVQPRLILIVMQLYKIALSSAVMLSIAILVWVASSRVLDTTCDYSRDVHHFAECVDSVTELLANPKEYDGEFVIVPGEFGFPLEGNYLKDSINGSSIWLSIEGFPEYGFNGKCGLTGQLKGVFTYGKSGHFGQWPGNLELIEFVTVDESNAVLC